MEGRAEVKRVMILAGGRPGWCPPACAGLYKPDRWGRRRRWRKTTGGRGPQMGGSGGWFSVGVWLVTFRRSGFRSDCCLSRPSSETSSVLNVRPPLSPGSRRCLFVGGRLADTNRVNGCPPLCQPRVGDLRCSVGIGAERGL